MLPSMRPVQKMQESFLTGCMHCDHAQWVTPSLIQSKPAQRKDSQVRLGKKDTEYWAQQIFFF